MRTILAILFSVVLSASAQIPPNVMQELIAASIPKAAASFTPTDISGLVRWHDAQSMSGSNNLDAVTSWTDKTGNKDFNQGEAAKQPLYWSSWSGFGNKPALKFDGVNDALTNANTADSTVTVFCVAQRTNTVNKTLFTFTSDFNAEIFSSGAAGTWSYYNPTTASVGGQVATSAGCVVVRFSSTSSADIRANAGSWVNFNPIDIYDDAGTSMMGDYGAGAMAVYIGEFLIYNSPLSDSDVNRVGNYLAARWGYTWTNL